ncbi:LCP family protein required for cell wall assembly [Okibacterium sp. HSC-33S16]|uniref:LCP family protein n=1 Tax=Okibacterium sp. HSC-33S16 TaxID=2910965 RepID=UPI0020A06DEE|nr:LCP family protein [Okibacterium sp. HSC-33S16]MCP2032160.1 LCP family protein required for cell wall assembly [Okibacterium sp. HSC-33S16]
MTETDAIHKSHWVRNTLISLAVLVVLVIAAVAVFAATVSMSFSSKSTTIEEVFPEEAARPPVATGAAASSQNILLLGSDTRGKVDSLDDAAGERSDTMMVAHIPASRDHIYIMSIMRDSWVEIPGRGEHKINAALAFGGVPLVVQTVESLISARIDRVAIVDFEGFKGVTDALGGVDVDNPVAFDSSHMPGKTFETGVHTLDGKEALAFVRERYAFFDGDFQRARNQQAYLKAVLGQVLSADTLLDPAKISGLVSAISPYLTVDDGFTPMYVAGLGVELRNLRSADLTFFTAPTAGTGTSPDGQSIVNLDPTRMPLVQEAFRTDTLDTYQPVLETIG